MQNHKATSDDHNELYQITLKTDIWIINLLIINFFCAKLRLHNGFTTTIILGILIGTLVFIISVLTDHFFLKTPANYYSLAISASLTTLGLIMVKLVHDSNFIPNRQIVADFPSTKEGVENLKKWFSTKFKFWKQATFSSIIGACAIISLSTLPNELGFLKQSIGFNMNLGIGFFIIGNGLYAAITIPTVVKWATRFPMNLFSYNPKSSPIVKMTTKVFSNLAIVDGLVSSIVILCLILLQPWTESNTRIVAFIWLILWWLIIFYSIIFPLVYVRKGISIAKEKTLVDLRSQITSVENYKNLYIDKLAQLLQVYSEVNSTSISPININAKFSIVGSLVLPTLTFISGSLQIGETIGNLFKF